MFISVVFLLKRPFLKITLSFVIINFVDFVFKYQIIKISKPKPYTNIRAREIINIVLIIVFIKDILNQEY